MKRYTCESCTFEWEGPGDETACPFCNSTDIAPYHPLDRRRCMACAYVWTEVKPLPECPVCGSRNMADYVTPQKVKCHACMHKWIARDDYPICPQCRSDDVGLDYHFGEHYDVMLENPGEMIQQVIHTVADICTVDIPHAAAMVERCPICIIDNLDDMDATHIRIRFEDMGARITLKLRTQGTP